MSDVGGVRTVIVVAHDPAEAAHILLHYVSDELLLLVRLHPKLGLHTVQKLSVSLQMSTRVGDSGMSFWLPSGSKCSHPLQHST